MKKRTVQSILTLLFIFLGMQLFAQVGINVDGSQPDPSAMLDVKSAAKGFLPPRVALTAADIPAPVVPPVAIGLLVYNTSTNGVIPNKVFPGYYYWNGTKWIAVATPPGNHPGEMLFWNGNAWVVVTGGNHGQQLFFCDGKPTWGACFALVSTSLPVNITQHSVEIGGEILSDGGSPVIARGVCWSTNPDPTIEDPKTNDGSGTGVFVSNITGLIPSTLYYVRSYATNSTGTGYGNAVSFTTSVYTSAPITTIPTIDACAGNSIDIPVIVDEFSNIGAFTLTMNFNTQSLAFTGATNTSGYPGLAFTNPSPGVIKVTSSVTSGISYPDQSILFTLHFSYSGGTGSITWFDDGPSCAYFDAGNQVLDDLPTSSFYHNGTVNQENEVGVPVFVDGYSSSRCQGPDTVSYVANAANATGITYTLDAASVAAGNTINAATGLVTYSTGWTGTSIITAEATGCNGPKDTTHTVTIQPLLPVSITISATDEDVCEGIQVTFTAIADNGGTTPAYQWKVNGTNAGPNSNIYTYAPADNDVITCTVISSEACPSGNPAVSNAITMEVLPVLQVGVTIAASENPACAGSPVTYTATPSNGGNQPVYLWKVNGNDAGTNSPVFTYIPEAGDSIFCRLTSGAACTENNPANSNEITMTLTQVVNAGITITASANPVCGGTQVTFTAEPVNGGTSPQYQWKVNSVPAGTSNPVFAYVPVHDDVVTCQMTSNAACLAVNPVNSNEIQMGVSLQFIPGSISANQSICASATPAELEGVAPVNGTSPVYQWQSSSDNISFHDIDGASSINYQPGALTATTYFRQIQNSTGACGGPLPTNTVTITVTPNLQAGVAIVADHTGMICSGTTVLFTATSVNGGANASFQWKVNGNVTGTTNATYSYIPADEDTVTCTMTSTLLCVTNNPALSNEITISVNPNSNLEVSVNIAAEPSGPVYEGDQVTFTATPVNGGTNPSYQWKVNGADAGTNSPVYSYYPQHDDAVKCILTSDAPCTIGNPATSNTIDMVVYPVTPVSVTIVASANPTCAGTEVIFTATPVNGGTTPEFQWKVNGVNAGTNNLSYQYQPVNDDVVTCVLTSSIPYATNNPATSNSITEEVTPTMAAGVTITAVPDGQVCAGILVNFTATATNVGAAPEFQWYKNGMVVAGATSATYALTPVNNDVVKCQVTSPEPCVTNNPAMSEEKLMVVNPVLPVSITISASTTTVCQGTQVSFTSSIVNGGTTPQYQWKANGTDIAGATDATYSYIPVISEAITCVLTSTVTCATGSPATSNTENITVNAAAPVTIAITPSANPVCAGTSVTHTSTISNGGTAPLYQWKLNGSNITGATGTSYTHVPTNGQVITCVLTSNAPCATGSPATSNEDNMTVNPVTPVKVFITATLYNMIPGTQVTYTATPTNGGTAPTYQWKKNGTAISGATASTYVYTPADKDNITCVVTSNSSAQCLTNNPATSNRLAMVVYMTGSTCSGEPTVSHGGQTYNTVQIGTQCWLRENLNIGSQINNSSQQTNNASIEKYCYNDSTFNCDVYGGLYQWNEMMAYVTTPGAQGICPTGWHVPTQAEIVTLSTFLGGDGLAGGKMKENGTNHFRTPNAGATNETGFTALPAGYSYRYNLPNPVFSKIQENGYIPTSTQNTGTTDDDYYYRGVIFTGGGLSAPNTYKTTAVGVRCLKN